MAHETSSNYSWQSRAESAIHHGALTNSKRAQNHVKGVYPTHITKGFGATLYDTNGKQYIDYICALGANLLGYANAYINKAIETQLKNGNIHSLPTTLEVIAAERLKSLFPYVDKWRFLKTGSDACDSAIKMARSAQSNLLVNGKYVSKKWVLSEGYHGHDCLFVGLTDPHLGVEPDRFILPLNEDSRRLFLNEAAAVIIEPIITDLSEKRIKWIQELKEDCKKAGCLLIFDEVITGFRFPKFSFSNYTGIVPDIIVLGKAIANGHALSAVGTKCGLNFNQEWFVSSTFAGETIAFAALLETINQLIEKPLEAFFMEANRFQEDLNKVLPDGIKLEGYGTRGSFVGDENILNLFKQETCRAGILFGPSFFYNYCHKQHEFLVLSGVKNIAMRINNNEVNLEGEPPVKAFAQKVRENDRS